MIKLVFTIALSILSHQTFAKNIKVNLEKIKDIQTQKKFKPDESKHYMIMYWATWCTSCKQKLKEVLPKVKVKNLKIITLNIDQDIDRAKHYIEKNEIKLPVFKDAGSGLTKLNNNVSPYWTLVKNINGSWVVVKHETGCDIETIKNLLK